MRIGYARFGRTLSLDPQRWGVVGGDVEPPRLLRRLAVRHPEDEFVLVGRTSADEPQKFGQPDNVTNPWVELDESRRRWMNGRKSPMDVDDRWHWIKWVDDNLLPIYRSLDAVIVWLGQHGSVHAPGIPKIGGDGSTYVTPQDWAVYYGGPVIRGINAFRQADPWNREEIWLVSDPRNYLKPHDLKWPIRRPILAQYEFSKDFWIHRYDDARTPSDVGFDGHVKKIEAQTSHWKCSADYVPSTLEICGVMPDDVDVHFDDVFNRRHHFGLFINEARATAGPQRPEIVRDWVRWSSPSWLHGKWTPNGIKTAGVDKIEPLAADRYFDQLRSTRCTFTTPSSGSGWATTKPWESFAVGTVCFRHPKYDDQNHVYGRFPEKVREWLSPKTAGELYARLRHLETDELTWKWLVTEQRRIYDEAVDELQHVKMIEDRIWK